ncbi:MAG: phosphatidylserine decarboxylase [Proteobacteria bacterium]|nr:phosphatidylserine decarboxylase [Pseudomonadota bacterium]
MGIISKALDIVPSAITSRIFGAVSEIEFYPPIQQFLNRSFAHLAHINMEESEKPLREFHSLNALFTRSIRPETHPISSAQLVSPVDGKLSFAGEIRDGILLQAKGQEYSARELAAPDNPNLTEWLKDAYAFTIYLSPSNYHRIHAPMDGVITDIAYVPGRLLPVNRLGYMLTDDLLPANERLTSFITRKDGHRCALVKVGATCVGRISLSFDKFVTNRELLRLPFSRTLDKPFEVHPGMEIACFELGSTVVLFVDRDGFEPEENLQTGCAIRMGMPLGNWIT